MYGNGPKTPSTPHVGASREAAQLRELIGAQHVEPRAVECHEDEAAQRDVRHGGQGLEALPELIAADGAVRLRAQQEPAEKKQEGGDQESGDRNGVRWIFNC